MNKKITTSILIIILLAVGLFFVKGRAAQEKSQTDQPKKEVPQSQDGPARIVSTKPDPLEDALVTGSEVFEITFSQPLENAPELKNKIEPKLEYKVELTQDRKTARFIPLKPYNLGATYTIFIQQDSKFDGGKRLDKEYTYHIRTIRYRGV